MDCLKSIGERQEEWQVTHNEVVVDPRTGSGAGNWSERSSSRKGLVGRGVTSSELREGQEDDSRVNSRVTFDRVHLPVTFREDEVEREMTGNSSLLSAGCRLLRELREEIGSPFFGAFADGSSSPVFVSHQHVVTGCSDESGDLAIDNRSMSAPF
jgi:hypothetical protein